MIRKSCMTLLRASNSYKIYHFSSKSDHINSQLSKIKLLREILMTPSLKVIKILTTRQGQSVLSAEQVYLSSLKR